MSETLPSLQPDVAPLPPDEAFWAKYNSRFEFPFSTVGAVLLHVVVALVIVLMLAEMRASTPNKDLRVVMAQIDGYGEGSPGDGTEPTDLPAGGSENLAEVVPPTLPELTPLPEVRETLRELLPEPNSAAIPDRKLKDYAALDKSLLKGLARGEGQGGTGPGGAGPDGAIPQSFRWTLRFKTRDGRDYVYQLGILRAHILVPVPPGNKECLLFEDLSAEPPRGRKMTDPDLTRLGRQVRFSDRSRDSCRQVARALGLDFTPDVFYAFFPDDLRQDWAAKERAFRGADPKDIEETVLEVTVTGGRADVRVTDQKLRKK